MFQMHWHLKLPAALCRSEQLPTSCSHMHHGHSCRLQHLQLADSAAQIRVLNAGATDFAPPHAAHNQAVQLICSWNMCARRSCRHDGRCGHDATVSMSRQLVARVAGGSVPDAAQGGRHIHDGLCSHHAAEGGHGREAGPQPGGDPWPHALL